MDINELRNFIERSMIVEYHDTYAVTVLRENEVLLITKNSGDPEQPIRAMYLTEDS